MSSHLAYGGFSVTGGLLNTPDHTLGRAQQGRFDSLRLTRLARAIDTQNAVAVGRLLAAGAPAWRDK